MAWKSLFTTRPEKPVRPPAGEPRGEIPEAAQSEQVFIARAPVYDASERVVGYQLLVRTPPAPARPPASPEEDAALLADVLNRFGVAQALGERLGFLRLARPLQNLGMLELLPQERFVLECPAETLSDELALSRCADLQRREFHLALGAARTPEDLVRLAGLARYSIYDLATQSLAEILVLDRAARAHNLRRLIRGISTRGEFEACKAAGFDLFQGDFFSRPESMAMNRLDPSRVRVIEIFNLVARRADVNEIEDAFKHDVALCYSLLCYINSVGIGLPYKVGSVRDAIMLLGYDFLWRWLSLLVYTGVDLTAAQRVLLNTAVIRGRLCELLGQSRLTARDGNLLFVVGMFSLLDILLGVPMNEIVARLALPDDVVQALVSQSGKYAPFLAAAKAFEMDDLVNAERLASSLGLDLSSASQMHIAAIEWSGALAR